jgi:2,3-dihydroxyphenylpropionate 1,2-dioxygenase
MASIVGCVNLAHSPFWNVAPPRDATAPGGRFAAAVEQACDIVAELAPDAVVIFGPDHARGLFYDVMPPFAIGVEKVSGVGDYDTPSGPLPLAQELARAVFDGVTSRGFDPAISLDLTIDHGLTQVYGKLFPALTVPIIPVIVNCSCPPLPTFARAWSFGAAVGAALAEAPGTERVVVAGSGGISHWPNSIDAFDPGITPEWRDFLIHGRDQVTAREPARRARLAELAADPQLGRVNPEWDEAFLGQLLKDPTALSRLAAAEVEADAGPGGGEVRTWAAASAAWGGPLTWTAYEPVPQWITGMGVAASHSPAGITVP